MPDEIDRPFEKQEFGDILLDEPESGIAAQVGNIIDRTRDEVIDSYDPMPPRNEQVREVRPEETRGAGNDGDGAASRR